MSRTLRIIAQKNIKQLYIQSRTQFTQEQVMKLLRSSRELRKLEHNQIGESLELLSSWKLDPSFILENPWLLVHSKDMLKEKLVPLKEMEPTKLQDFIPLMKMPSLVLRKMAIKYKTESAKVPGKHRVYYFSKRLDMDPSIISKYLAKRQFIFFIPFTMIHENLSLMLKNKVAPISILRDLWVFRYKTEAIKYRFNYVNDKIVPEKPMPWMVRCPTGILNNSLQISIDHQNILGSNESTVEYLAERLQCDPETMRYITSRHPAVLRVRMTKIKAILDFFILEEGFPPHDILQVPQILRYSLDTIRMRVNKLKSYGCVPSSLTILCKSQQEFEKFANNWLATREKLGLTNKG
uniref:Putative mitochondrial transcription termination factor n=1 Tax=Nyssomyia neivai TaxID=330878 RepID=A0A1L8E036_9DIPT